MSDRYAKYNKLKFDYPADRVLRITFDRPETFNSVDAETHTQMTDMWIDVDRDPNINAVIVTGAGKAFSAGGDFSLIEEYGQLRRNDADVEGSQGSRLQHHQLQ